MKSRKIIFLEHVGVLETDTNKEYINAVRDGFALYMESIGGSLFENGDFDADSFRKEVASLSQETKDEKVAYIEKTYRQHFGEKADSMLANEPRYAILKGQKSKGELSNDRHIETAKRIDDMAKQGELSVA